MKRKSTSVTKPSVIHPMIAVTDRIITIQRTRETKQRRLGVVAKELTDLQTSLNELDKQQLEAQRELDKLASA